MHDRDLLPLLLITLIAAPVLGRLAAWRLGRWVDAVPGQARKHMPSLPLTGHSADGSANPTTAARRFDSAVRSAQARAVPLGLACAQNGQVCGLQAHELATQLAVPVEVTTALLADWRSRLPCRLRVTRNGLLLHDFTVEALQGAVRQAWHAWPQRLLLFVIAMLANLGALWWVVVGLLVGIQALRELSQAEGTENQLGVALLGIVEFAGVYLAAQAGAWLVALTVRTGGPKLAPQPPLESLVPAQGPAGDKQRRRQERMAKKQQSSEESDGSSSTSSWIPTSFDVDGEGCLVVLLIIAVAILIALVAGSLAVVGIWLFGLWRAVKRLGEPDRDMAPLYWLQRGERASKWERWLPTNDLALRLVRALRRLLLGRPGDDHLAPRLMARAKRQHGRLSALEIAMDAGLDLPEAIDVGARLLALYGGDMAVTTAGDIDFALPIQAWQHAADLPAQCALEYLGQADQRLRQPSALAVNVPGLALDHLGGAMRLAGGPWITLVVLAAAIATESPDLPVRGLDASLSALFCLLAPGTLVLAAVTDRAVRQGAMVGILRDIRHFTIHSLRRQLDQAGNHINVAELAGAAAFSLRKLKTSWSAKDLQREIEAMLVDLGLEPDDHGGGVKWSVVGLRQRLAALAALRAGEVTTSATADDEVVFDTGEGSLAVATGR